MSIKYTIALLLFTQTLFGQHEPLFSSGTIPKDFTTPSHLKYKQQLENVDQDAKRRTKKNQKKFYLESSFSIDELLQSGLVMSNDPVSKYVTDVANILLKNEPKLKNKLRFYTVRTPSVNAFATGQGIILVNMGLISQLENEAQLAFILAHEIAHYQEEHSLKVYLESKDIDRKNNKGYFNQKDFDAALAKNQFSKEQESEADELGMQLYLQSEYNLKSVNGVFDVLQYSYLPFDDLPFNKSYFEDDYLIFDDSYHLDSINIISTNEEVNDDDSTHPSIPKRRNAIESVVSKEDNVGRKDFIVSENRFNELRLKARYEILDYYLRSYGYYQAIYNAYLLQQQYPNDLYLKKIIAKSLYGMVKFSNANRWKDLEVDASKIEGEAGRLVYFFNKTNHLALNTLALRYIYKNSELFKDDEVYHQMLEDVAKEWMSRHEEELEKFKIGKAPELLDTATVEIIEEQPAEEIDLKEQSKYEKIRAKKEETKKKIVNEDEPRFIFHGFGDLLEQKNFKMLLEKNKGKKKKSKIEFGKKSTSRDYSSGNFALGEKKILVINPFYLKLKKGFKEQLLVQSEKLQIGYIKKLDKFSKQLDLEIQILDYNHFTAKDIDALNDLREIQEWYGHHLQMEDEKMIAFNQERINEILKKYDVDAIMWTGVISSKTQKTILDYYVRILYSSTEWLYSLLGPKGETIIFSIVLDKTGEAKMATFDLIKFLDNQDIINQHVYDILKQVRQKPQ